MTRSTLKMTLFAGTFTLLAACTEKPVDVAQSGAPGNDAAMREMLVEREKGNTGGANYGEFGPPDAYENGSQHPYYGSENVWSRRQFSERASGLYYKRRGQRQMLEILDGRPQKAIALADVRLATDPDDLESLFTKTVALSRLGELDAALQTAESAVAKGLPLERFLAGPRDLLAPLVESDSFQSLTAGKLPMVLHGPMVGAVTDSGARIWVRLAAETAFEVHAVADGETVIGSGRTSMGADYAGIAHLDGLKPGTRYVYRIVVEGEEQPTGLEQTFRTAPEVGTPGLFQLGFGGCAGYTPAHEYMWDTIDGHGLDAFLFLGDNVYIDLPGMPNAFHDYSYYRRQSRPEYRRLVSSTPVYAIWDDHDAAYDDIWMGPYRDKPVWKQPMVQSFARNWVNPYNGSEAAPGTWFDFSVGDVDVLMLDGRTYRTNPFDKDPSMLGPEQKAWLLEKLKASRATIKLIASPVGWADGVKPDSVDTWLGFKEEREEIFRFIEENKIEGVVLLSSDRHRSEAWEIKRDSGYTFYDLNSGQLTNIHTHNPEPGALFSYNKKDSFGRLTIDTTKADPEVTYQIFNIDNELIETLKIRGSQLRPATRG